MAYRFATVFYTVSAFGTAVWHPDETAAVKVLALIAGLFGGMGLVTHDGMRPPTHRRR